MTKRIIIAQLLNPFISFIIVTFISQIILDSGEAGSILAVILIVFSPVLFILNFSYHLISRDSEAGFVKMLCTLPSLIPSTAFLSWGLITDNFDTTVLFAFAGMLFVNAVLGFLFSFRITAMAKPPVEK